MTAVTELAAPLPDVKVSVRQLFGFDSEMEVPAYSEPDEHVPDIDSDYRFDRPTTLAILAGFARNRRVIVTGYHGTGKSTHIEQVAARLNWPCVRVNLDSHISRTASCPGPISTMSRWCSTNTTPAAPTSCS
jgi:cobaltochelatase CobS